jgi:hypothetical protein
MKMGMSTYAMGFRDPDETWKKHKAVWDACRDAGIDPPEETRTFFDDEPPDEAGIKVQLGPHAGKVARHWDVGDGAEGLEITIADLPKNITKIRFVNSW